MSVQSAFLREPFATFSACIVVDVVDVVVVVAVVVMKFLCLFICIVEQSWY